MKDAIEIKEESDEAVDGAVFAAPELQIEQQIITALDQERVEMAQLLERQVQQMRAFVSGEIPLSSFTVNAPFALELVRVAMTAKAFPKSIQIFYLYRVRNGWVHLKLISTLFTGLSEDAREEWFWEALKAVNYKFGYPVALDAHFLTPQELEQNQSILRAYNRLYY